MDYTTFSKVTGQQNPVTEVRVRTDTSTLAAPTGQDDIAETLEDRFENAGFSSSTARTQYATFDQFSNAFDIILIVLMVMAAILAVVGGLSLTGTMGMNVFERTREIGVLRAVGASTGSVRQVVVVEGVVVGLISWVLAAAISGPMGVVLAGAVVRIVMDSDLVYQYSFGSLGVWLLIVIVIGVLSSLAPARNAAVLTVREVLDYE
jgi:putative ABC transport system permease protein